MKVAFTGGTVCMCVVEGEGNCGDNGVGVL